MASEEMKTFIRFVSHNLSTGDNLPAPNEIKFIDQYPDGLRVLALFDNWYQVTQWLRVLIENGFYVTDCRGVDPYHTYTEITFQGVWGHPVIIGCPALDAVPQEILGMIQIG